MLTLFLSSWYHCYLSYVNYGLFKEIIPYTNGNAIWILTYSHP